MLGLKPEKSEKNTIQGKGAISFGYLREGTGPEG